MSEAVRMTIPRPLAQILEGHVVESKPPAEMIESPDERAEREATANEHRTARYLRRLPKRYRGALLSDLDPQQQDQGQRVSTWLDAGHQTLVLASAPGLGKTYAAYALCSLAVRKGAWCEAWTVSEMLSAIRREMRDDSTPPKVLDDACNCDLLLLDDLGRENQTGWADEQTHNVLDVRLREGRRVIVTTNLGPDELGERYGHPLVDRLRDDAVIVKMTGTSRRRAASW